MSWRDNIISGTELLNATEADFRRWERARRDAAATNPSTTEQATYTVQRDTAPTSSTKGYRRPKRMKAIEAMLCYNPGTDQAIVVRHPDFEQLSKGYAFTVWACSCGWRKIPAERRIAILFVEAWQAVIRDRVDPAALHRAMLVVDEYRLALAEDVPGVAK